MRELFLYSLAAWTWLLFSACQEEEPLSPDQMVVDGVLYTGQPGISVRLWSLAPLSVDQPQPQQADAVLIRTETMDYFLSPQMGNTGTYFDASGQLQLLPQAVYQLVIVKNEVFTIAVTQVPLPPEGLALSQPQYAINASDRGGPGTVGVFWNNPDGNLFAGKILLLGAPGTPIDPDDENLKEEVILDITQQGSYQIPYDQLHYYGDHALILYALNPEYRDFFGNGSSELRLQQYTNVFNGLGIFTALTPDTAYFQVIPR